ncbi:DUF6141 family protein [Planktothricoides raciborskii]|uniref:Uncharacterized protein n=1 Tax=Planktothricoides raciborskii FACHB-1370 TaxID=2949576 RepID=A0ABR8E9H2_9CYAN|nr:DUF6141 family protein [Planktothricoides raciborskii]MBD2543110.1 hypothetical protein [Planktothricoides raciborskii FACHB-1370]MBD2585073.1 hypothetical protein [Planktothricoides raciborskii FACHB-1261]
MDKLEWPSMAEEMSITEKDCATLLFREVQQFRQPWIWIVLTGTSVTALWAALSPFFLDSDWQDHWVLHIILILFGLIFGIGLPWVFYVTKLVTEIRSDGLVISFYPLLFSPIKIYFKNMQNCTAIKYKPLQEYGGWGVRLGAKGTAYNVSGNRGVQIELINGSKILIGSKKSEVLAATINLIIGSKNSNEN